MSKEIESLPIRSGTVIAFDLGTECLTISNGSESLRWSISGDGKFYFPQLKIGNGFSNLVTLLGSIFDLGIQSVEIGSTGFVAAYQFSKIDQ